MPQPIPELSMLDAVALFNGKPPAEWTTEELAAFKARLEKSPSLVGAVGGKQAIDRRLAEVEAAIQQARQQPAIAAAEPATDVAPIRKTVPVRRLIEAALFVVLISGAGYWIFLQLREMSGAAGADKSTAAAKQDDKPKKVEPAPAKLKSNTQAVSQSTDLPADSDIWQGWHISTDAAGKWNRKRDWDLSNPSAEKFYEWLVFEDGVVRLKQRRKLTEKERWLEIRARPQPTIAEEERVVIRVGGKDVAQLKIGTGETRWPAFVSLEPYVGREVDLEVIYEAGAKGQQIFWKSMAFVPQKREIAKRINCGGPAIESPDGDWEADDNKVNPYLTSSGTRTWTIKVPVSVASDLQAVYQDERWANQFIEYKVPVEPGTYDVVLHFAETNKGFQQPDKRQFDIILNGHIAAEKFDIFKAAGGPGAYQWKDRIEVKEGPLEIRLQGHPAGPAIKGLEVLKVVAAKK